MGPASAPAPLLSFSVYSEHLKLCDIRFASSSAKMYGSSAKMYHSPGGSVVKNLPANAGDAGSIPGLGISWRRTWQHTPVFLPGESHGQRSLVGYSSWAPKRIRYGLVTKQQQLLECWPVRAKPSVCSVLCLLHTQQGLTKSDEWSIV